MTGGAHHPPRSAGARQYGVIVLIALVALATYQDAAAWRSTAWRMAILSWDGAASRLNDDAALDAFGDTDLGPYGRNGLTRPSILAQRLGPSDEPRLDDAPSIPGRPTRAPPHA